MKHAIQRLHFVGIGGAGMGAIAEVLHHQGYRISGSDQADGPVLRRLAGLGVRVFIGHAAVHLGDAQAVVVSAAVMADNPEVLAARAHGLPVVARAVVLAELMRGQGGIAVAGTHGKTTTTALVAAVLIEAGCDPSVVIGAPPGGNPPSARCGQGPLLVAEADESDASFLHLSPVMAVVTNIDADHLDTYGQSLARLLDAFTHFLQRLPFYGQAVLCLDDPGVRAVLPRLSGPVLSYGLDARATVGARDVQALPGGGMRCTVWRAHAPDLPVELALSGVHNVRNALAAIAVAFALNLPDAAVQRALASFGGVGRRFARLGQGCSGDGGRYLVIDDYGHHPAELAAVREAARAAYPGRRLMAVFQPHRYTRTRDCLGGFVAELGGFDAVLLTEVYAAGDAPIPGADGAALAAAVRAAGRVDPHFIPALDDLPAAVRRRSRDGDVVLVLGAGSIGDVAPQLVACAAERSA